MFRLAIPQNAQRALRALQLPHARFLARAPNYTTPDFENDAPTPIMDDMLAIASFRICSGGSAASRLSVEGADLAQGFVPEVLRRELASRPITEKAVSSADEAAAARFGGSDVREPAGPALEPVEPALESLERERERERMLRAAERVLQLDELEQGTMDFQREQLAQLTHDANRAPSRSDLDSSDFGAVLVDEPIPDAAPPRSTTAGTARDATLLYREMRQASCDGEHPVVPSRGTKVVSIQEAVRDQDFYAAKSLEQLYPSVRRLSLRERVANAVRSASGGNGGAAASASS